MSTHFDILASYTTKKDASYLRPFTLCLTQDEAEEEEDHLRKIRDNTTVMGLVDSGAVHSSYISLALALHLDKLKVLKQVVNKRVCTGIKGSQQCSDSSHAYDIVFDFVNERTLMKENFTIRAQVIDSQFDLIIGQPDIFQFDLAYKFPSLFSKKWSDDQLIELRDEDQKIMQAMCSVTCDDCKHSQVATNPVHYEPLVEKLIVAKEALLDRIEHDWDMIDEPDRPWEATSMPSETSEGMGKENVNRVPDDQIHGTDAFKERIRTLLDQYETVFRAQLTPEPAALPCFQLVVDTDKWLATAGGRYPRQMSKDKEKEVERQVRQMLELKLIKPSTVSAASHVMLAPKSGGKWRFCVDYRTLNLLSESLSWPIPNIKHMLERIGSRQARYFGVLDLSQGFYQVPLAEESKALTAFITWCGTFEWNRLPMGIKSAPVYFQFLMVTIVLLGLIHVICEIYIDDILIHAQTEDEFCANLTAILERCKSYNILLNPAKCKFGLDEVEYVGHTINSTGLHFTRSKLDSVLDFELPQVGKQLKSFIGFCNYFRDHVENFSAKMQPLNELLRDYDKRRRLVWSEESRQAFEDVKKAVHECPTLFFMDVTLPVFMHTDASKYGIGAYLFQIDKDGNEKPIAFISKTLTDTQRRWHTPQKEAYAIFYAFKQLDYLIRGVKFTLRTDHKNLIYINDTMTEMVIRWKIAVQDYDFDIEHIPGVDNIVADGLSRLIEDPSKIKANETKTSFVPQTLALLCPFEPENEMDYLLCNFWEEEIEADIFCPLSDNHVQTSIPAPIRKLIGKAHNSFVGHHGRERTLAKIMSILKRDKALATQFSELTLTDYVAQFIKQCPVCQKLSTLHVPIQAQAFTTATYEPHQRLNIDTIGPLPPDADGHCYILVLIDTFTRWIELYAIKTVTALEAAKVLLLGVFTLSWSWNLCLVFRRNCW